MQSVKEFYNKYNYPKLTLYTNKQKKRHLKLVKRILSYGNLKIEDLQNKSILCAGCGTGDKAIFLSKFVKKVVCLDFSKGQLKVAETRAKNQKIKNIAFKNKDILNDNLKDLGKFDLILSLGVLHHTENAKNGFEKLVNLLKPKGIIIIALYHKYARLRYRINRFLIHSFVSKEPDNIMKWLLKSKIAKPIRKASLPTLYDRYAVSFESYHTLREVRKWFKENNINLIKHSNNIKKPEFLSLFAKKTLFFVGGKSGKTRKIR